MKYLSGATAAILMAVISFDAQAASFQDGRNAASFDMFLPKDSPDNGQHGRTKPVYMSEVIAREIESQNNGETAGTVDEAENNVDYNMEIARELFPQAEESEDVVLEANEYASRIFVPQGRTVEIKLIEQPGAQWHVECNEGVELASNSKNGNEISFIFNAEEIGNTKIYLDYVDKSENEFKVIASRYINVIVG